MKSKYQIWFTNNHENFADNLSVTEESRNEFAESYFATNDIDFFISMFRNINDDPIAMWYWVIINDEVRISGAIDPSDKEYFEEIPEIYEYLHTKSAVVMLDDALDFIADNNEDPATIFKDILCISKKDLNDLGIDRYDYIFDDEDEAEDDE